MSHTSFVQPVLDGLVTIEIGAQRVLERGDEEGRQLALGRSSHLLEVRDHRGA